MVRRGRLDAEGAGGLLEGVRAKRVRRLRRAGILTNFLYYLLEICLGR